MTGILRVLEIVIFFFIIAIIVIVVSVLLMWLYYRKLEAKSRADNIEKEQGSLDGFWEGDGWFAEIYDHTILLRQSDKKTVLETNFVVTDDKTNIDLDNNSINLKEDGIKYSAEILHLRYDYDKLIMKIKKTKLAAVEEYDLYKVKGGPFSNISIQDDMMLQQIQGKWCTEDLQSDVVICIEGNELLINDGDSNIFRGRFRTIRYTNDIFGHIYLVNDDLSDKTEFGCFGKIEFTDGRLESTVCDDANKIRKISFRKNDIHS